MLALINTPGADPIADFDAARAKMLGEWTHEAVIETAKLLWGSTGGATGGAMRFLSPVQAQEVSKVLFRSMEAAQVLAPGRR